MRGKIHYWLFQSIQKNASHIQSHLYFHFPKRQAVVGIWQDPEEWIAIQEGFTCKSDSKLTYVRSTE